MTEVEVYRPMGIEEMQRYAKGFAASGYFQDAKDMSQAFAKIAAGAEMGIPPFAAMTGIDIIKGKASVKPALLATLLDAHPDYDFTVEWEEEEACTITILKNGRERGKSRFSMEDAKTAGLLRNETYKTFPRNMLWVRAMGNAIAWYAPGVAHMRVYGEGELGPAKHEPIAGEITVVEGEEMVTLDRAMKHVAPEEEVIEDAEIVEPEPNVGVDPDAERTDQSADENAAVREAIRQQGGPEAVAHKMAVAEADERFSAEAVEAKLREDLPKLSTDDREIVKALIVDAGLDYKYTAIVKLIVDAGYSDVFSWLRAAQDKLSGAADAQGGESLPAGVTGRQTGSQTAAVLSDRQLGMFNAKCSEAGLSEAERKTFIRKFAQVESSKQIAKADFDELLAALRDIASGGPETKAAFLGD